MNRGSAYSNQGKLDEALTDLSEAVRVAPDISDAHYNLGVLRAKRGQYEAAISEFTEAIRLNPNHALAYWARGATFQRHGQYEQALADYNKASTLGGARLQGSANEAEREALAPHLHLGVEATWCGLHLTRREYGRAIEDCGKALVRDPNDANAYSNVRQHI
jgi:tetratricopeptide (TPR) repeat protein